MTRAAGDCVQLYLSRYKYEGHRRAAVARGVHGGHSVVAGDAAVGEDDVEVGPLQRSKIVVAAVHVPDVTGEAAAGQREPNQLGIVLVVLQVENSQLRVHGLRLIPEQK